VLGGAPVLADHEVLEQRWDRRQGHEKLVLANDRFIEELQFEYVGGTWRYSGGGLWERSGDARGRWLWSLEHSDHEKVGTAVLPSKTEVRSPGEPRRNVAIIRYERRDPNPSWAAGSSDERGADEGGEDEGGWEGEDDEGGWEGEDEPTDPPTKALAAAPAKPATVPKKSNIPELFRLEPSGLPPRGDLCR
jgi:hypothetical protein